MFYSNELLGKKSPLGAVWLVHLAFAVFVIQTRLMTRERFVWQSRLLSSACVLIRAHFCFSRGSFMARCCRIIAHGKKLNRPKILGINIVETW